MHIQAAPRQHHSVGKKFKPFAFASVIECRAASSHWRLACCDSTLSDAPWAAVQHCAGTKSPTCSFMSEVRQIFCQIFINRRHRARGHKIQHFGSSLLALNYWCKMFCLERWRPCVLKAKSASTALLRQEMHSLIVPIDVGI